MDWPALRAARSHDRSLRIPFRIEGQPVGSVARAHLPVLAEFPQALELRAGGLSLTVAAEARNDTLAELNAALRAQGLIKGWRDECYAVVGLRSGAVLAQLERAAARFWGTLTFGAHANGYRVDIQGRPSHLWIAQRSFSKATDPGLYDNLVGGGVPGHQTPLQALLREGFEEAGLDPTLMQALQPGRVLRLDRDIPEGRQLEQLHAWDLPLPAGWVPQNHDGEVLGFECMPVAAALALAASARMTVDASLVTLDFALRHALLPRSEAQVLQARLQRLFVAAVLGNQMA